MPFLTNPPAGTQGALTFAWVTQPLDHPVGGDALFQEVGRPDGRVLLLLVDVTHHGESAAEMVHLLADHFLSDSACDGLSPAALLTKLHGMLLPYWAAQPPTISERFVEALALLVDASAGRVVASRSGAPFPYLGRPGGPWHEWPVPSGRWLGVPFLETYAESEALLPRDSMLLAFTDGVSHASDADGRRFGKGPLQEVLKRLPVGARPDHIVAELFHALAAFDGGARPDDDRTALCLRWGSCSSPA
jgi:serine phosphatase RsbU (regulator of sigma subunit)